MMNEPLSVFHFPLSAFSSFIIHHSSFIVLLWLFAMGAAIGSFLNVVVYRLPRGISLIRPGSHCPACKRPIRWRDNIPVLGWLLLGGRCRDCKAKIAFRYPLVEAITAGMFLAVGWAEGFSGGANLPNWPVPWSDDVGSHLPAGSGLAILVAYHLVLLCTLLAAGFIQYDGQRLPLRLMLPAMAIGGLAPLVWPQLRPVSVCGDWSGWIAGLAGGAAGLAVGALLGFGAWYALGGESGGGPSRNVGMPPHGDAFGLILGPACVGLFLGWQAATALGILTVVLHGAATLAGRKWPALRRPFPSLFLAAATLGWILAWKDLVRLGVW